MATNAVPPLVNVGAVSDGVAPARRSPWRWPILLALAAAVAFGACRLWFLCDDAFIAFRYVANAHDGHGLVWNRAPFAPVEGYTCFLWVMLLWAVWAWSGIEPPVAANWLSLGLGLLLFALLAAAALRLRDRGGRRLPDAVGLTALAVIAGNRSFLQWFTSGLETALFNLGFAGWVLLAFARKRDGARWLAAWSSFAAVAALTRPDGLLAVAVTFAAAVQAWRRRTLTLRAAALGATPLLAVVAHVAWRRWYYGQWLPNTWQAKIVEPWPEAGLRYFASFAVEHGTWLFIAFAAVWLLREHVRQPAFLWRCVRDHAAAAGAVAACLFQVAYYVFRVGGDHFEYRVFSHLVPLMVLATAAMGVRMGCGVRGTIAGTLALGVAASAGWLHFALTRDAPEFGFQPLAPRLPAMFQPAGRWYDRQQAWLLFHNIGLRCEQHARLLRVFMTPYPARLRISAPPDPFPVFATGAVGVVGWSLPDCAILDLHGLNDRVVARTPVHGTGPALTAEHLRPAILAADLNKDGWLEESELRGALAIVGGKGDGHGPGDDYLIAVLLAICADSRPDALSYFEAENSSQFLLHARSMAHERHPPPGYVEAFAPNVTVANGIATARPRREPLTAERVRAIEQEWWQRALTGTLLR